MIKHAMVEVFITNVSNEKQAISLLEILKRQFPSLSINFEIEGAINNYPCDHNILRFEGVKLSANDIIACVKGAGYQCDILEDKICA